MGAQQILLITLGVIVVGVATIVGVSLFTANYDDQLDAQTLQKLTEISADAVAYAKRPASVGGGNGSFAGYSPAPSNDYTVSVTATATTLTVFVQSKLLASDNTPAITNGTVSVDGLDESNVYDHKSKAWKKVKIKKDKNDDKDNNNNSDKDKENNGKGKDKQ